MKRSVLFFIVITILCGIMYSEIAITYSSIPPPSRTGAPSEGTCSSCHGGSTTVNKGPGDIIYSMEGMAYFPDSTYTTTLTVIDTTKVRFGFQIVALDSNNMMAGSWIVTNTVNTAMQTTNGRTYLNQKNANTNNSWLFNWTAPSTDIGRITFYIGGNAADNNSDMQGDNGYKRAFTVETCDVSITNSITGSYSDTSGSIDITVVNGIGPYTYAWSNGDTIEDLSNLLTGDYTVTVTDGSNCTASTTINVPIWIGVDDIVSKQRFDVYPNPSTGIFQVQSNMESPVLRVYDLQGSLVIQRGSILNGSIDLSSLKVGIYTLSLSNKEGVQYKKVVIQ